MNAIRHYLRFLLRLLVVWFVDTLSLLLTAAILPGFAIIGIGGVSQLGVAAAAAFLLGIVNLLIRPLVLLLSLPFGFIAVFVAGFFVNAVVLRITASLLPGFQIDAWLTAFIGSLILSVINTILTAAVTIDDEDSFYQGIVERLATRTPFKAVDDDGVGLIMIEIDGLSYWHLQKALEDGLMPTLQAMMAEQGYSISRIDCGLPSQTSACQSGIMFGDNYDIPAFRWYDKDQGKLMVSGHDATEINARYANGKGLMRGGSSINNMMNGDAAKSLLTLADLTAGTETEKKQRADDIYLLMLNPYFLMRTIVLFFGDVLLELWQGWQQRRKNIQPRLNRLHGGYPLIRAATTVFMRDVASYLTILDIIRGTPVLYVTWPGYDEVAHHSGPWTSDAFSVLAKYDRVIARVQDIIERKAPRPYEIVVLSDHGQSHGATFLQRYGYDLKTFIESQLPQHATVVQTSGGDEGVLSVTAMAAELQNVTDQGKGSNASRAVVKRTGRFLSDSADRRQTADLPDRSAQVTVCGSGNLAQVYFDLFPRKITVAELEVAYPGIVDALIQHDGVGFVVAYEDDGTPMVFGKQGALNLHTGALTGIDPLLAYGDADLRARQVRRIADYPHAGDLIINSTLYPDGSVAAMEELVGNHGGLGGEQTDAFLFHPPDLEVPETTNSADVFPILNGRRGHHEKDKVHITPTEPSGPLDTANDWAISGLREGIRHPSVWLGQMLRAMTLDRIAYQEVVRNPMMTWPAVVIAVVASLAAAIVSSGGLDPVIMAERVALWVLGTILVFAGGRVLGGKGSFTATLRAMGFGQAMYFYGLVGLFPPLLPISQTLTLALSIMAAWMAGVQAHQLRGWKSVVFPLIVILLPLVSLIILGNLLEGADFTIRSLIQDTGIF